jgi:hypothetical protein
VLVDDIRLSEVGEQRELSARVTMDRLDTDGLRIWFRAHAGDALRELDASPFLPGLLVTAMWWNEKLTIDGPVSSRLLASVDEAVAAYRCLYPSLPTIGVSAPSRELPPGDQATACLFSRGVDSWYSLLTNLEAPGLNRPQLSHIVYVPSIDFMYGDENRARSIAATRRAAEDVGCTFVLLETNLRDFTERFQEWGITFGGGLAGMGLFLGERFSHLLLAASFPLGAPTSFGSHPALDPRFSTERTEIVHDGATASRVDKVRYLATRPVALENLKVCYHEDLEHNCGRCGKCVMTMLELHACRALDKGPVFDTPLHPRLVAKLKIKSDAHRVLLSEVLSELGDDSPLTRRLRLALEWVLLRHELRSTGARMLHFARSLASHGTSNPESLKR